jgi:uncharacterized protein YcaQ
MAEYRYFLPRMERYRTNPHGWRHGARLEHPTLYPMVLDRIRDEGPLSSADFEHQRDGSGTWWNLKPTKMVLEDLADQGILMVADRRSGFQRVYDLAERVLPADVDTSRPTDAQANRHLLLRGARALGIGTLRDHADYFRLSLGEARPALRALLETGDLVEARVEGWAEPAYAPPDVLAESTRLPRHRPLLIGPFDPLVWERQRAERLFGFEYRIEIYTPEQKRRYGYYVLPLLVGGQLVGRVDVRNDRANRILRVPAVHLEPGQRIDLAPSVAAALLDLANFLQAAQVEVERTDPPGLLSPLRAALAAAR